MIDYKLIKCPKCGKSHFKELSYSSDNSTWFLDKCYGISDSMFRIQPERIYKDGKLANPEDFTPSPSTTSFECLECGCNFSVKTTYEYIGGDIKYSESHEIIDDDKVREEREAAFKKQQEEREKERKKKEAVEKRKRTLARKKWEAEHPGKNYDEANQTLTTSGSSSTISAGSCLVWNPTSEIVATIDTLDEKLENVKKEFDDKINSISYLGNSDKSEIDLGGVVLKSNIVFTERQIKRIKKKFGFEVTNLTSEGK